MGGREGSVDPKGRLVYVHNGGVFLVTKPIDGSPATAGNGCTIGFAMTPEQADAWHAAGVANGGTAVEDPPGVRGADRSEEHTSELQSLMRHSYAVFCLKKQKTNNTP